MYVCQLDRPWLSTPFPFQGFVIKDKFEIDQLQSCCGQVFVDIDKGQLTEAQIRALARGEEKNTPLQPRTNGSEAPAPSEALVDGAERESVVRDIAQLAQELASARDRDSIATLVLNYLSKRYSTCALFICRRDEFRGWRGAGPGFDARRLSSLKLSVDRPSALAHLKNGARYHAGPLTPNEAHKEIAAVWDEEVPRDALVVPARVAGRLALAIWCVPKEVGSLDAAPAVVRRGVVGPAALVVEVRRDDGPWGGLEFRVFGFLEEAVDRGSAGVRVGAERC